ncbi:hypothetical protein CASFOL_023839 [Castilleja foliolosa]|uniref:RNase H type-1 domain-containing protein n=1 Tax=Castilleja foliolosa TaxID=1961234 RepID=A0ABD3CLM9_9LAMI
MRNEAGTIFFAAAYPHPCLDATTVECLAIMEACQILEDLKIKSAIIESDCLMAISLLNGSSNNSFWTASPVIERIKKLWNDWPSWIFKYTQRRSNGSAHALAKWADTLSLVGIVHVDSLPVSVFCDYGFPILNSCISSLNYVP